MNIVLDFILYTSVQRAPRRGKKPPAQGKRAQRATPWVTRDAFKYAPEGGKSSGRGLVSPALNNQFQPLTNQFFPLFLLLCIRLALNLLRQYRLRLSRAKEKGVFLLLCIRLALYLHSKPLTTTFQYARRKEMPQRLRGKNGNERHAPRRKARSNSRR